MKHTEATVKHVGSLGTAYGGISVWSKWFSLTITQKIHSNAQGCGIAWKSSRAPVCNMKYSKVPGKG